MIAGLISYQPSRLAQGRKNYTNNHDIICYFVKGGKYGKTRFNQKGKNPGNVWGDIKQLTYKSKELVSRNVLNTIQKPEKLMERTIKASSNPGDIALDPFSGVGTCPVVCHRLDRRFIGVEQDGALVMAANGRLGNNGGIQEDLL